MFDISFSELILIAIVALVVIGPERLPEVVRTIGPLLARMQRYITSVRSDISREMQLDELRKLQNEMYDSAQVLESGLTSEMQPVEESVSQRIQSVKFKINTVSTSVTEPISYAARHQVATPIFSGLDDSSTLGRKKSADDEFRD